MSDPPKPPPTADDLLAAELRRVAGLVPDDVLDDLGEVLRLMAVDQPAMAAMADRLRVRPVIATSGEVPRDGSEPADQVDRVSGEVRR